MRPSGMDGLPPDAIDFRKCSWDEASESSPRNKSVNLTFLADMEGDFCMAEKTDSWGRHMRCIRLPGHTGRHLATEWKCRYPIAVWC